MVNLSSYPDDIMKHFYVEVLCQFTFKKRQFMRLTAISLGGYKISMNVQIFSPILQDSSCLLKISFKNLSGKLVLGRRKLTQFYAYYTVLVMSFTRIVSWKITDRLNFKAKWLKHNLFHICETNKTLPECPSVQNLLAGSCVIFITRINMYHKYSTQVIKYIFPID